MPSVPAEAPEAAHILLGRAGRETLPAHPALHLLADPPAGPRATHRSRRAALLTTSHIRRPAIVGQRFCEVTRSSARALNVSVRPLVSRKGLPLMRRSPLAGSVLTAGFCTSVALLAACASNPGVAPIGPDTYIVTRQAATGFSGAGSLMVNALREANTYCANQKRSMVVVSTEQSHPPYIFTNFPRAEVQFRCLVPGDPQLSRPTLRKDPV